MTRLGRPVQTGWHAIVPPLHMHTRQQFQIRAASALADSKLTPSCAGTNSGAIVRTGIATGMSAEVNESYTVCLSDHHWNTTNAGPWSRAQLRMWERLVPSGPIPQLRMWERLVPRSSYKRGTTFPPMAYLCTTHRSRGPCNLAVLRLQSATMVAATLQCPQVARQVYPTSLKEEPHGLGGRATPKQ